MVATDHRALASGLGTGASTAETEDVLRAISRVPQMTVKAFHDKLCETSVLDPACGTGNFLYVSLELMKRLEGEVLEALLDLGGQEALRGIGRTRSIPTNSSASRSIRGLRRSPNSAVDRLSPVAFPNKGRCRKSPSCGRSRTSWSRTRC